MDTELREIERRYRCNPKDESLLRQLVTARRRCNHQAQCSEDIALDIQEIRSRWKDVNIELTDCRNKFEALCGYLFKEYPGLQQFTILLDLPEFMDGDPLRPGGSLLITPFDYGNHGLIPYEESFIDFTPEKLYVAMDPARPSPRSTNCSYVLMPKPTAINASLFQAEFETIEDRLWCFYEFWKQYFGLNCRVDIYRAGFKQPDEENTRIWHRGKFFIEQQPYKCGY